MEKLIFQIKVTETEDGFRVEGSGDRATEMLKGGCIPIFGSRCCCGGKDSSGDSCCETDAKK